MTLREGTGEGEEELGDEEEVRVWSSLLMFYHYLSQESLWELSLFSSG